MTDERLKDFRRERLRALLAHEDFGGNKAALGRALGYDSGAFIRQMTEGERPVSEKTIAAVEAMRGGKFKGWFLPDGATAAPEANSWPLRLVERARFEGLSKHAKERAEMALLAAIIREESGESSTPLAEPAPARKRAS